MKIWWELYNEEKKLSTSKKVRATLFLYDWKKLNSEDAHAKGLMYMKKKNVEDKIKQNFQQRERSYSWGKNLVQITLGLWCAKSNKGQLNSA